MNEQLREKILKTEEEYETLGLKGRYVLDYLVSPIIEEWYLIWDTETERYYCASICELSDSEIHKELFEISLIEDLDKAIDLWIHVKRNYGVAIEDEPYIGLIFINKPVRHYLLFGDGVYHVGIITLPSNRKEYLTWDGVCDFRWKQEGDTTSYHYHTGIYRAYTSLRSDGRVGEYKNFIKHIKTRYKESLECQA